jgi:hypothetical protein
VEISLVGLCAQDTAHGADIETKEATTLLRISIFQAFDPRPSSRCVHGGGLLTNSGKAADEIDISSLIHGGNRISHELLPLSCGYIESRIVERVARIEVQQFTIAHLTVTTQEKY